MPPLVLEVFALTGGATTTFTWDVARSIAQVLDDGDLMYVYGLGRVSQVDSSDVTHYYLTDGLGSTMALTNASKTVVNDYDIFGAVSASSGSLANFFEFAGEQSDDSTDLQYLRARYYDPATGRFISRDPFPGLVRTPGTLNPYPYVLNGPANYVDPTGLICISLSCAKDTASAVGGAVVSGASAVGNAVVDTADAAVDGVTWCAGNTICRSAAITTAVVGGTVLTAGVLAPALGGAVLTGTQAVQLTAGVALIGVGTGLGVANATNNCQKADGTLEKIGACAAIPAAALGGVGAGVSGLQGNVPGVVMLGLAAVDALGGTAGGLLNGGSSNRGSLSGAWGVGKE